MFDLRGKVAVLTGATMWLGRDMAEVFAENGCDIIITSRTKEKADKAAAEIAEKYGVDFRLTSKIKNAENKTKLL